MYDINSSVFRNGYLQNYVIFLFIFGKPVPRLSVKSNSFKKSPIRRLR